MVSVVFCLLCGRFAYFDDSIDKNKTVEIYNTII